MEPRDTARNEDVSLPQLAGDALRSAAFAIQSRVDGAAQTVNQLAGTELSAKWLSAPEKAEFGTARWHAQQLGEGVGAALPYFGALVATRGLGGLVGKGLGLTEVQTAALAAEAKTLRGGFLVGGGTGFAYDGLTAPVSGNRDSFWSERRDAAIIGAATVGTLNAGLHTYAGRWAGVRSAEVGALLRNPFVGGTLSGAIAGGVNAEASSLVRTGQTAGLSDIAEGSYTFAFTGLAMGGLSQLRSTKPLAQPQESAGAWRANSQTERPAEARAVQREINRYGDEPLAVMSAILNKPNVRVLAVGEAHSGVDREGGAAIVRDLMPAAKKAGVGYYAVELRDSLQPVLDHHAKTGKWDRNLAINEADAKTVDGLQKYPLSASIESAHAVGIKVVAIDHPTKSTEANAVERNPYQAARLAQLLESDPQSKVIWTGGSDHIAKSSSELTPAITHLRNTLSERGIPENAVVSAYSASNTGAISNIAPIVRGLNYPVALPVRQHSIFANMPFSESIFPERKFSDFDYLIMSPKRVEDLSGNRVEHLHDAAAILEAGRDYPRAQRFLYDAWQVHLHENSPYGNLLLATDLSRIERRLGNDARSNYFMHKALEYNRIDPVPENESSLRMLADPKYYRPRFAAEAAE